MNDVDYLALEGWGEYRQFYDESYAKDCEIFMDGFRGGWFAAIRSLEKGLARKLPTETLDELLRLTEKKP